MTRKQVVVSSAPAPLDNGTSSTTEFRIDAGLLIPGRGEPIESGALVYSTNKGSKKILWVGATSDLPKDYKDVPVQAYVPVLMPGLWDCHVHFLGEAEANLDHLVVLPQALAGARGARDVAATLNAGFTSVRELAGYGVQLSQAVNEGWLPGPNIYSSVAPISMTAGHGDLHTMPLDLVKDTINHGLPLYIADGVDDCTKAVRVQIRRGAKVIKVCATGGVMSRIDSPTAPQFSPPELKAMVEEARRASLIVAAHCHGKEGIVAALHAGVRTIEHGSYLDKEAIELLKDKGAMLIATRSIVAYGIRHPDSMPPESYKKIKEIADTHKKNYAAAVKAGVKCALGTDLGVSKEEDDGFNHGMNGREFGYAVEAGMTPLQAIEAGTASGPDTLGPQAPLSGELKAGYDADFIALSKNPLEDIKVLAETEAVTHVWKGGKLYKSPGKPLSFF